MATGVKYRLDSGAIVGALSCSLDSDLDGNADAVHGVLPVAGTHDALVNQRRWRVVADALVAVPEVTLTPDVPTFAADGVAVCTVTLTGLTHDVSVGLSPGGTVTVTTGDPAIVITSDTPGEIRVWVDDPDHWAEPLTVRAV